MANKTIEIDPLVINDPSFIELMNQLKMAGDTEQSKAILELGVKIDELTEQVRILNEHLSEQSRQREDLESNARETFASNASNEAVGGIKNAKEVTETVSDVRGTFMDGVKNAGRHIKEYGIKGVNKCFDFLRIRDGLEKVRDLGDKMLERDSARMERIEERSDKFHRTAMHIGNAGRELSGKELKTEPSKNGKMTSALQKPVELKTKITKAIINGAEGAINKLDNMQAASESVVPEQTQEASGIANNGGQPVQDAGGQEPGVNQMAQDEELRRAQMEQMLSPDMGM